MDIAIDAVRRRISFFNEERGSDRFLRDVQLARDAFATLNVNVGRVLTTEEVRQQKLV